MSRFLWASYVLSLRVNSLGVTKTGHFFVWSLTCKLFSVQWNRLRSCSVETSLNVLLEICIFISSIEGRMSSSRGR